MSSVRLLTARRSVADDIRLLPPLLRNPFLRGLNAIHSSESGNTVPFLGTPVSFRRHHQLAGGSFMFTGFKRSLGSCSIIALFLFACLSATAQTANNKVPLTHEMMWMLKRVGSPNPSPDGKWVVFSLVEPAY